MNCTEIVPEVPERRQEGGICCCIGGDKEVSVPFWCSETTMLSL
jgi:hypothetical protein